MAKNIDAKLKNIQGVFLNTQGSLLDTDGTFIVPEYQRAYSWRYSEQCDKLWQDIETFIDRKASKNETYFFGSIIINNDSNQLLVIDGQQRLTTFMLLLKALHIVINDKLDALRADEEDSEGLRVALENRRSIIVNCLYSIDEDDVPFVIKGSKKLSDLPIKYENKSMNEEYPHEMKTILCGRSFEEITAGAAKIDRKHKDNRFTNFYRNFKFFWEKLRALDSTAVNSFAKALLQDCQVIVIVSYQTEEAIEIFNSLNSTGLPLTDADILSAKLYNQDPGNAAFKERWGEIVKNASSLAAQRLPSIDDILNQYMYILRAENGEKDTQMPSVRRYFTDLNRTLLQNPMAFITGLERILSIWQDGDSTPALAALKQILLRHNNNFKFFYATYFYFHGGEPNEKKQEFVEALLKLFAILSIKEMGYSSAAFKSFLFSLNAEIGTGASTDQIVGDIKTHIKEKFRKKDIEDTLVQADPENAVIYLNEYLFAREHGKPIHFDVSRIEIEHIMPASGRNLSSIREDANMSKEDFDQCADKLGNKILLEKPINGSIGRDWFMTKKQTSVRDKQGYKDSVFPIAASLVLYPKDKWEKTDIDKATKKAAERIADYIFS